MAAQQLTELFGAPEGVGDQLAARQRDRRFDPAIALRHQVRAGREVAAVSLGEAIERRAIGGVGEAQRHRGLPGRAPV